MSRDWGGQKRWDSLELMGVGYHVGAGKRNQVLQEQAFATAELIPLASHKLIFARFRCDAFLSSKLYSIKT